MPSWPGGIPQAPLLGTFVAVPDDDRAQSALGLGPARLRERTTSSGAEIAAVFGMDGTQRTTFATFYTTTLTNGSASFTWTHPIDFVSRSFVFLEPPSFQATTDGFYRVSVKLYMEP